MAQHVLASSQPTRAARRSLQQHRRTNARIKSTMRQVRTGAFIPAAQLAPAAAKRDVTAQLLQSIFKIALQSRLKSYHSVDVAAVCDARSLLEGLFNGISIEGHNWVTPLQLTAEMLQVEFGAMQLDISSLVWQRKVKLQNVPAGNVRIILSAEDLGNFMVHPIMASAASRAVQDEPFLFDRNSVDITREQVAFAGSWRGSRYELVMTPGVTSLQGQEQSALQVTARAAGDPATQEGAAAVALGLCQFFGNLELDLQGIEISSPSLTLVNSIREEATTLLEIQMKVQLRALPPLNMQF